MFLYFDRNGVLKEIINDKALRAGNSGINKIYIYVEDYPINVTDAFIRYECPLNSEPTPEVEVDDYIQDMQIPYDPKRDLKYFKYYTNYDFYMAVIPDDVLDAVTENDNTIRAIVRLYNEDFLQLGDILFTVSYYTNKVEPTEYLSIAQYNYLLSKFEGIDYSIYDGELSENSVNAVQNKALYNILITRSLPNGMHGEQFIKKYGNVSFINYFNSPRIITVHPNGDDYKVTVKNLLNENYYKVDNYSSSSNIFGAISADNLSDENPFRDKLYFHNLYLGKSSDETETYYLRFYSNRRQAITNDDQSSALEEIDYHIIRGLKLRTVAGLSSSDANVLSLEVSGDPFMNVGKSMYIRIASGTQKTCILETFTDTVTEV